jgi:type IV pilus assembly protein PilB
MDLIRAGDLGFLVNLDVRCALAERGALREAIKRHYGIDLSETGAADAAVAAGPATPKASDDDDPDAPIIRLVNHLFEEAMKTRSSDIHVESMGQRVRVRTRVDGELQEVESYPKHLQGPLLSRLKIMAGMDIAEKRKPQDGRINLKVIGKEIDVRVSALPSQHGESMVMRLLDKESGLVTLEELGFHGDDVARFRRIIRRPNGVFLVTGPTGSGKTTTLYAALQELNRPDVKIITAENPVEYHIQGINQAQVNVRAGLTFARILRSMLRQAPNIILVGEIRDQETAEIAVQAALTGHLVFSTLHTNDAPSAITRLIDMGCKPFLAASAVQAVMAQRLLRLLCRTCRKPTEAAPSELHAAGIRPEDLEGKTLYRAVGCPECRHTGYRGRKGIFELMEMAPEIRDLTFRRAPTQAIREQARLSGGMLTLLEDGVRKALAGITSLDEVLRTAYGAELAL